MIDPVNQRGRGMAKEMQDAYPEFCISLSPVPQNPMVPISVVMAPFRWWDACGLFRGHGDIPDEVDFPAAATVSYINSDVIRLVKCDSKWTG